VPESARLRLRLLGRFAVDIDSEPPRILEIPGRLRRAILAYLAMQPSFAETRERLAALLWGESLDRQARQNLRQCLLDLRRELEPVGYDPLKIDRETIALHPDLIAVDAREFLALCQSDDLADLEEAIGLYAGPFLDGLDFDSGPFHDWVGNERVRFESAAALAFEKYALRQDEARNGAPAIRAAERLVALDPLRESAQRLLIRILARHGGRDAALAQASAMTATLRSELDAAPESETAALIEEIRRSSSAPVSPVTIRHRAAERMNATGDQVILSAAVPERAAMPVEARTEPAPWRSFSPRVVVIVGSVAAGATAIVGVVLALFAREPAMPPRPNDSRAASEQFAADPTWRSPGIVPGIAADDAALATTGIYPIAVLPFATDAPAGSAEARLASRISDDLISDLSRSINTRVISAQTSRLYGGRPVDVAAVGAELGVRYVVEGNVRIENSRMRVNAALTDAKNRLQIWSDRFDYDQADHNDLQDEITRSITRRLQINLIATEDRRRPPRPDAGVPGIDDLLAKGWAATTRISLADKTTGADTYFAEVLKRDPDNVSALTGLGAYHVIGVAMFLAAEKNVDVATAEQMLDRAIALKPDASLAYYYRGVLEKTRGRPQAALEAFTRVLQLNPSYAPAYAQVGHVLSRIGQLNEAMDHVRYAVRLSPKDHNIGTWSLFGGQIELERGHDEAAFEWLARALEVAPRNPFISASLAAVFALRDDREATAKHAAETRKLAPWLTLDLMIERLVGLSEQGSEPRRLIEGLRKAFPPAG